LRADFGADAMRPKSANTISQVEHIVRAYLAPRFGIEIAKDIKLLDIQRWFKSLHETGGLAWTTIAKMRGVMSRIYLVNKAKVEPKTVQGILRHSRIQTTLDFYTKEDSDEARGAQGEFLKAVGVHSGMTQ